MKQVHSNRTHPHGASGGNSTSVLEMWSFLSGACHPLPVERRVSFSVDDQTQRLSLANAQETGREAPEAWTGVFELGLRTPKHLG